MTIPFETGVMGQGAYGAPVPVLARSANLADVASASAALANLGGTTPAAATAAAAAAAAAAQGPGLTPASLGLALLTMGLTEAAPAPYTATAQQLLAVLCTATVTRTVTVLGALVSTAGVTAGTGVNKMGIFSAAGALLGVTGDMTTAMESTGKAEGTLTAGVPVAAGTNYYLAALADFTGTALALAGAATAAGALGSTVLAGTAASQAAMPSTLPSLSAAAVNAVMWAR